MSNGASTVFGIPAGIDLSAVTLQAAYDGSNGVPQINLAAAQPFTLRDNATPIGDVFVLEDDAGVDFFNVDPLQINFGIATQRLFEVNNIVAGYGGTIAYPDDFTRTVTGQSFFQWTSTLTSAVPGGGGVGNDTAPNFVNWAGEIILTEQGNLFNTQSLFSQGTQVVCQGASTGPIYTLINQPNLRTGSLGGARTGSQQNAVRSQLSIGPNDAGTFTLATHEPYFAVITINASGGAASCTAVNYFAPKAPNLIGGGTVGTLNLIDFPDVPIAGISTLRGLNSAMDDGNFILHSGDAPIDFTSAAFRMDFVDNAAIRFGTGDDVLMRWDGSSFDIQFQAFSDVIALSNPDNNRFLISADVDAEFTINAATGFSLGAGILANGNTFGSFVAGGITQAIAGEVNLFLQTQAANYTINQANTVVRTWTVNASAVTLSGPGTVTDNEVMRIQGNPATATVNRTGLRIVSNPSGGSGVNAALWCENGDAVFDGRVDINNGIALGGGAAATLGTIGGSGPTAAAQAQWVEIDIGGVAHWIPAWT